MKVRLLLFSIFTMLASVLEAEPVETLIVKLKNGTETEFFLKDKPNVSFEGTSLKVTSSVGDASFALADVLRFTYAKRETSCINGIIAQETGVDMQDGILVISQLKAGATVSIYSMDGKLVRQLNAHRTGTYRLSLSGIPSGVYLIKADNVVYKIHKP